MPDTGAPRVTPEQVELINAGFQPARYGTPVRLVRRLLWPFIRPFHFHTLARIEALAAAQSDAPNRLQASLDALGGVAGELRARIEGLEAALAALRHLRGEIAAVTNRFAWVEGMAERLEALARELDERSEAQAAEPRRALDERSEAQTAELRRALDERSEAQTAELRRALDERSEAQTAELRRALDERSEAQAAELRRTLDERARFERLFLHATDDGLFILKAGDLVSEAVARDGSWDSHILRVADLAATRRPEGCAVDAGAHFGLITVALARRFPHVVGFEPNWFSAGLLAANVALNGLGDRVAVYRNGLFSRRTTLSLAPQERQELPVPLTPDRRLDAIAAPNLAAFSFSTDGIGIYQGSAYALDDLALQDVAFLKVDTQGADGEVILGALETIGRCRPWVVFEWEEALSRSYEVSWEQVRSRLQGAGYTIRVLKRHNEKQVDYLAVPEADSAAVEDLCA